MKTVLSILILGLLVALCCSAQIVAPVSVLSFGSTPLAPLSFGANHSPVSPSRDDPDPVCAGDYNCCVAIMNLAMSNGEGYDTAMHVFFICMGWDAGTLLGGGRVEEILSVRASRPNQVLALLDAWRKTPAAGVAR